MKETTIKQRAHVFTDDVLSDLDGVALAKLIREKELHPSEVVAAAIERAKKADQEINAVVTECYDKAIKTADQPVKGFFGGIPTFIKDMTFVKGVPTYFGSEAFSNAKPSTKTDPIAKQIFEQGFIHLGNSSMPEFGFTCSTEFPNQKDTCNPWNTSHTAGGSSGGAAALVAAGVIPIAHSADGGGSTRIPAACCGLVGLKPSRGRLLKSSLFDVQLVDIAIDGVITRTVRDTAYFYAEAEKYYKNRKLPSIGLVEGPSKKKYKIGYTGRGGHGRMGNDVTMKSLEDTVNLLESMGHSVQFIEVELNKYFEKDFANLWAMNGFFCHKFGKQLFGSSYQTEKLTKLTRGLSKYYWDNVLQTPAFIYRLNKSYYDYAKIMSELGLDIVLMPTLSHPAPKLGHLGMNLDFDVLFQRMQDWAYTTPFFNANGAPSISLPLGHDDNNDLPIGMLFSANHGQEATLFDLAYQLEAAKPWRKIYME
ncbi:MAG: amidase [Chitinophagales bacterium]